MTVTTPQRRAADAIRHVRNQLVRRVDFKSCGRCLEKRLIEQFGATHWLDKEWLYVEDAGYAYAEDALGNALAAILFPDRPLPAKYRNKSGRYFVYRMSDLQRTTSRHVLDACNSAILSLEAAAVEWELYVDPLDALEIARESFDG